MIPTKQQQQHLRGKLYYNIMCARQYYNTHIQSVECVNTITILYGWSQ